jgi:hypothetical protein
MFFYHIRYYFLSGFNFNGINGEMFLALLTVVVICKIHRIG